MEVKKEGMLIVFGWLRIRVEIGVFGFVNSMEVIGDIERSRFSGVGRRALEVRKWRL